MYALRQRLVAAKHIVQEHQLAATQRHLEVVVAGFAGSEGDTVHTSCYEYLDLGIPDLRALEFAGRYYAAKREYYVAALDVIVASIELWEAQYCIVAVEHNMLIGAGAGLLVGYCQYNSFQPYLAHQMRETGRFRMNFAAGGGYSHQSSVGCKC